MYKNRPTAVTRRMLSSLVVFSCLALGGIGLCDATEPRLMPPPHVSGEQLVLADCTSQTVATFPQWLKDFGFNPFPRDAVPVDSGKLKLGLQKRLVDAASRWALETCYLPCPVEMCATLLVDPDGNLGAYIGPTEFPLGIAPEAVVWFEPGTLRVEEAMRIHSPCRQHARDIGWIREGCE